MGNKINISFIIPAKNEEKNIPILYKEIAKEIKKIKLGYEIIFIDDGSTDKTYNRMLKISRKDKNVKLIKLRGNFGKSVDLQIGFEKSKGDLICTLDADLQDNPKDLSKFLEKINEGYDLVSGWKQKRQDPISKVIPSRIFNFVIRKITGLNIHDINCGFKVYKRDVVKNLNLYGELFRFIPLMALKQHYKVAEVKVSHRPRRYGKSKYGFNRNYKGLVDLATILFLTGYFKRPAHFFGTIGLIFFAIGFFIGIYISYLRFSTGSIQYRQPLLFLGILLIIVGIQLITTGLVAELLISTSKNNYDNYIKKKVGIN